MESAPPHFELQEELQRFTTQFTDRVTQASEELERSPRADVRAEALRKNLLYVSAAMEIASGQFPVVNLLDMVVFVRLARDVLQRHWIPTLYCNEGNALRDVFARSDQEISDIAARVLTPEQCQQLEQVIDTWLAENPSQVRVEGIRLADFASAAGEAAERTTRVRGLLANVKTATQTANLALQLSERGLFLFQRLPFLWRLQARLAARELMSDSVLQLTSGPEAPVTKLLHHARRIAIRGAVYLGLLAGVGGLVWWARAARGRRGSTLIARIATVDG